jgi:arsenite-transporting ATPase
VRVVLFTGKGGVGKTTLAAATAAHVAAAGSKTLVLSTDPAHSLADALGAHTDSDPREVASGLFLGHVDAQRRLQDVWGDLQQYLVAALGAAGLDSVRAEELTVLPGAEELLALIEVRDQVRSGRWDAVIVDCAPTAETLRLLALPEALDWYLNRALPAESRVARALRPLVGPAIGLPSPPDEVWSAAQRLQDLLLDVQQVLQADTTTVRLVLTPEAVVVAEARRALTQLSLYGYRVDGVIANRVFPESDDPWRAGWAAAQHELLDEVRATFDPLPVQVAEYQQAEPLGPEALRRLGQHVYGERDPLLSASPREFLTVRREGSQYVLSLALPLVDRDDLDLTRVGDDLVVTVAGRRRVLTLPSVLRRCRVRRASVREQGLDVVFAPDPELFPANEAHP